MTIKALFPTVRPTLNLDFANSKVLDPRVTFTRASTGTFVGSNGVLQTASTDVPRFDHNPTTGESLGLLVEEARTNLLLRSEEFNDASWLKVRASISANTITAPNGTLTADTGIEDTSSSTTHNPLIQDATVVANGTYTASLYVRAKERSRGAIWFSSTDSVNYVAGDFNLTAGTITASNTGTGSGASAAISNVGNGWFRVSITGSIGSSLTTGRLALRMADATGNIAYTGDGTSGIYVWGAQLEAGAFPTSYIPTTSATATRAADVASITGTNFSSWYNQTEGVLYAEGLSSQPNNVPASVANGIAALNDNSTNNRIDLRLQSGGSSFVSFVSSGGAGQATLLNAGTYAPSVLYRSAVGYAVDNFARIVNGGSIASDTSGLLPVGVNRLWIGAIDAGTSPLNGTIKRLTYWPVRLPNTTLQAITTP